MSFSLSVPKAVTDLGLVVRKILAVAVGYCIVRTSTNSAFSDTDIELQVECSFAVANREIQFIKNRGT